MLNIADISVIIPYYNSDKTIKRALESVLAQSLLPKEILIINDKSNSESLIYLEELVKIYARETSVKLYIHSLRKNSGAGEARNYGWDLSSCDLIAFLDSDDSWHPRKLEIQQHFFQIDEELILCGHSIEVRKKPSDNIKMNDCIQDISLSTIAYKTITKKKQLFRNRFATSTIMIRNSINLRFEPYKRYSEDFLLWSEIISSDHKAINLSVPLATYFKPMYGSSGLSSHMHKMYKGNLSSYLSIYKKRYIGSCELVYYISLSTIKYLRRLIIINLLQKIFHK